MTVETPTPETPARRRLPKPVAVFVAAAIACASFSAPPAVAQGWWPFGGGYDDDRPPVPREPVRRPQPIPAPIPEQAPPPQQAPMAPPAASNWATKNPICLQLEQRLVQEGQKGNLMQTRLPQIESEIRTLDRNYNVMSNQLDRGCYEYFLFTKTFRNTGKCKALARQVEDTKQRLTELEAQRQEAIGSGGRSYRDDIIRELARNNCGANYVDEARQRDSGYWRDEDAIGTNNWTPQGNAGVATYRTLCVRLCDGYYFPVSFSTLPSHFAQDAESCSSRCAAPAELFYYPNPGGTVDQAVALKTQEAYTKLKEAFRYRKEYVKGCSCKAAEYVPDGADANRKANMSPVPGGAPTRHSSATAGAGLATGSTTSAPAVNPAAPAPAPEAPAGNGDGGGWNTEVQ